MLFFKTSSAVIMVPSRSLDVATLDNTEILAVRFVAKR